MYSKSVKIYPSECRQRAATYKAKLSVTFKWLIDGQPAGGATKILGQVPIMVKVRKKEGCAMWFDLFYDTYVHVCKI